MVHTHGCDLFFLSTSVNSKSTTQDNLSTLCCVIFPGPKPPCLTDVFLRPLEHLLCCRLQVTVTGCRLQVAGYMLQVAGYRLQVADCRLQVAGCRL
jgi:hypothetical protein